MKFISAHALNYTAGRSRPIDHIVIHYTGNNGDTAEGNARYFSRTDCGASAHYFADENEVVQSVKEGDTAHHAGNWVMNTRSIGVEMCSRKDANGVFYIPAATVKNAQALVRELMAKYNVPLSRVLRHYDVTGKRCPEPFVRDEKQWKAFLEGLTLAKKSKPSAWAKEACDWAVEKGIVRGDETGECKWQSPITKEQMALMLFRALA